MNKRKDRLVNGVWIDRRKEYKGNEKFCQKHFETLSTWNGCYQCDRKRGLVY